MLFSKLESELFICVAKIIHEESILRTPKNLTILHTVKNIDLFFHDYFRTYIKVHTATRWTIRHS